MTYNIRTLNPSNILRDQKVLHCVSARFQRFQHLVDHRVFFDGRKTLDKCLPDKRCKERFVTDYMDRVNKNFLPTYYYVYNTVATQLVFFFDLRVRETRRQKMLKYSWGLMLQSLSVIHVILLNMLKI